MLADSSEILGMVMPGPGTTSVACLGAAIIDAAGNIDSTEIPGRAFLVGSGGGNDVASVADDVVVVTTLTAAPDGGGGAVRDLARATRVSHLVTDLGTFEKRDGRFVLTAAVGRRRGGRRGARRLRVGLVVADDVAELDPPTAAEVEALRRWDPRGFFLGHRPLHPVSACEPANPHAETLRGRSGQSARARRFEVAALGAAGAQAAAVR